jgi:hypothetical protein
MLFFLVMNSRYFYEIQIKAFGCVGTKCVLPATFPSVCNLVSATKYFAEFL